MAVGTPVIVRAEEARDHARVRAINIGAFETPAEASLVDRLRREADPFVSLVAEVGGVVVGHILFTPVTVDGSPEARLMGLAPMAVDASHRDRGVGSALVRAGLERCREMGVAGVVVLGHPDYYPRFGFRRANAYGLRCEYEAPGEAWMAVELGDGALAGVAGLVRYHGAFRDV
jgi:putative acetyltransferase